MSYEGYGGIDSTMGSSKAWVYLCSANTREELITDMEDTYLKMGCRDWIIIETGLNMVSVMLSDVDLLDLKYEKYGIEIDEALMVKKLRHGI